MGESDRGVPRDGTERDGTKERPFGYEELRRGLCLRGHARHVLAVTGTKGPHPPVSNRAEVLERLSQSSEMAVTCTSYFSPHLSIVMWQLPVADVQFREAPVPSTAEALYKLAPNTRPQVTVTMLLEQL